MCICAVVVLVSEAHPDSAVLARSITVGSDHRAHYLFIGSSRLGDLTVVTTRRGGECAAPPHTEQAISQCCSEAVHLYSKQTVTGRESRRTPRLQCGYLRGGVARPGENLQRSALEGKREKRKGIRQKITINI